MISLNPQTNKTKFVWMDGNYEIFFTLKEVADQYQMYHNGIVIPI